jgi:hypothetical protein
MDQSLASNLAGFADQVYTGMVEAAATKWQLFNQVMGGAVNIVDGAFVGNFPQAGFFQYLNTVSRRDITSASARSLSGHTATSAKSVMVARKANDDIAISALREQGLAPDAVGRQLGMQIGEGILKDAFDTAIYCAVGTLLKAAATYKNVSTQSSDYNISIAHMFDTMQLLGDHSSEISAIVMHSKVATDLKKALVASTAVGQTAGAGIMRDDQLSGYIMRPVYVTDSPALYVAAVTSPATPAYYRTLLLTRDALNITKMDSVPVKAFEDNSYENSLIRLVAEYDLKLTVKGFSYTNTNANPTVATLATTSNWTQTATSVRHGLGSILVTR